MPLFSLPLELFLEIFSYLSDHRRFIRENYYGRDMHTSVRRKYAERSITIRRLTMTCWSLRNRLLPLLWTDVEGCISHNRYDYQTKSGGEGSHLYAQCVYLSMNPAIAAYVRTFSVNLYFMHSPEDLMTKFVECIVRLPNLKTLEILNVGSRAPISKALRRKHAIFPSVRELRITPACHHFIKKCPNLESVTFVREMDTHAPSTLRTHGKGLRRIAGVTLYCGHGVPVISWSCSNLREIGIIGSTQCDRKQLQELRQLKKLSVIDVDIERRGEAPADWEQTRAIWKKELTSILKDSPSRDRKILRWKVVRPNLNSFSDDILRTYDVVENEEIEVSQGTKSP